ncbi:MAG TPA: hypothetical protein VLT17_00870 [Gemmatimonadales bacterium]|nr:hypothetical protein [Gemmatimonadales bacterium]
MTTHLARRLVLIASLGGVSGCRESPSHSPDRPAAAPSTVPAVPDSLALPTPGGAEVWFTDARAATDSAGRACTERVMEIRQGGRRTPIPLLYTGAAPEVVNDSTIRARVWLHCQPGASYLVNLRTGVPARVP